MGLASRNTLASSSSIRRKASRTVETLIWSIGLPVFKLMQEAVGCRSLMLSASLDMALAGAYSARSIAAGSIRTARITAGTAPTSAATRMVSDGTASAPTSVAFTS